MVEVRFRSNLIVRQLLDAAQRLCGKAAVDGFRHDFAEVQSRHTQRVFSIADGLINGTFLSPQFHESLRERLARLGIDLNLLDEDALAVVDEPDAIWQQLIRDAFSEDKKSDDRAVDNA